MHDAVGIRRLGAAALDLAYVAAGRFGAYFEFGLKPWDLAAGAHLVVEAGGRVTDPRGTEEFLASGDVVATNGRLHPSALALLRLLSGRASGVTPRVSAATTMHALAQSSCVMRATKAMESARSGASAKPRTPAKARYAPSTTPTWLGRKSPKVEPTR